MKPHNQCTAAMVVNNVLTCYMFLFGTSVLWRCEGLGVSDAWQEILSGRRVSGGAGAARIAETENSGDA